LQHVKELRYPLFTAQAENAEKNTYKRKIPHNFSAYSLTTSDILAISAVH